MNRPLAGPGTTGPSYPFTKQGVYEESETAKHNIGDRLAVGDRVFFYASAGEALYAGFTAQQALYGGATTTLQTTTAVTVAAAAGKSRIYVNALTTAQSASAFAGGWIAVFDATTTGKSWIFKIKDNSALATSGVTSYVDIYDELPTALTTSDQCEIIANPYKGLIAGAATATGAVLGISPINVTSGYYFWCQTYGPCSVYPEAALDLDEPVVRSDATAGTVCKMASATAGQIIGYPLHIGTAAEASIVFLTLRSF
jgi:hypothetical protein